MPIEFGGSSSVDQINKMKEMATTAKPNKVNSKELAELVEQAVSDDGKISNDELLVINTALGVQGVKLSSASITGANSFNFTMARLGDNRSHNLTASTGKERNVKIIDKSTIGAEQQTDIKDKTGMNIDMKGSISDGKQVSSIVKKLVESNGFDVKRFNSDPQYAQSIKDSIGKVMPNTDVNRFCSIIFKQSSLSTGDHGNQLSDVQVLQKGLQAAGLGSLLSQDGISNGGVEGKFGLRTATSVDRLLQEIKTETKVIGTQQLQPMTFGDQLHETEGLTSDSKEHSFLNTNRANHTLQTTNLSPSMNGNNTFSSIGPDKSFAVRRDPIKPTNVVFDMGGIQHGMVTDEKHQAARVYVPADATVMLKKGTNDSTGGIQQTISTLPILTDEFGSTYVEVNQSSRLRVSIPAGEGREDIGIRTGRSNANDIPNADDIYVAHMKLE